MSTDETVHEPTAEQGPATDGHDGRDAPRFWHRGHPVFTPLTGFFTGVLLVVLLGGLLSVILDRVVGYDVGERPWILLVAVAALLVVTLVLLVPARTRRFARYMLFGVLATPAVVAATASLTLWLLYLNGD